MKQLTDYLLCAKCNTVKNDRRLNFKEWSGLSAL